MTENRFHRIRRATADRGPLSPPSHFDVGVGNDEPTEAEFSPARWGTFTLR